MRIRFLAAAVAATVFATAAHADEGMWQPSQMPQLAAQLKARGRHDPCVLPRAVPMVEAMAALVMADHALRHHAISGK